MIHPQWAASKQLCIQGRDSALRPRETVEAWEALGRGVLGIGCRLELHGASSGLLHGVCTRLVGVQPPS